MAVSGNTLFVYGGIVEVGFKDEVREVTLDDLWSLDLNKLQGWNMVSDTSVGPEAFKENPRDPDSDMNSDDDDDDDDDNSGSDSDGIAPKWHA